jgi:hypothetical protein
VTTRSSNLPTIARRSAAHSVRFSIYFSLDAKHFSFPALNSYVGIEMSREPNTRKAHRARSLLCQQLEDLIEPLRIWGHCRVREGFVGCLSTSPRPEQQQGSGCFRQYAQDRRSRERMSSFIAQKLDIFPLPADVLLTSSPTTWYILQRGIHRITAIYSPAPSASGCVRRRGLAPDTRGPAQESRKG